MSSDCHSSTSHYWSTLRVGGSDLVEEVVVVDREGRDQRVRTQYDPVSQAGQILGQSVSQCSVDISSQLSSSVKLD